MSKFLYAHDTNVDNNNDAKAIAIPRVLSENSQAKNDKFYTNHFNLHIVVMC